ncbi:MAG: hypothetical protein V1494_01145 [Candidatus Diapherotrites archaeon]
MNLKRNLYRKGNSFFTGIPIQALGNLNKEKKYSVLWVFDPKKDCWEIRFEERNEEGKK